MADQSEQVPLFTDGGVTWTVSRQSHDLAKAVADITLRIAPFLAEDAMAKSPKGKGGRKC